MPAIGGTEASGVFLVVRYVLANGSDGDVRVSQDDFKLVAPDGTALSRSEPGMNAWEESPGGYELTDTVLLKPGGAPRSWVVGLRRAGRRRGRPLEPAVQGASRRARCPRRPDR